MAAKPAEDQQVNQVPAQNLPDPEATQLLFEEVRERLEELRTHRFEGGDPISEPKRVRRIVDAVREGAIAALVAERAGALLRLDEALVSPTEDLAVEELNNAYRALAVWDLRAAEVALDRAASFARLPEQQQRIALGWALRRLIADLLRSVPGEAKEKTLPSERSVLELLETLDRLPREERDFYSKEVRRLAQAWQEAARDERLWCIWALLRARVALLRNEGVETALAWLLRLARRAKLEDGQDSEGLLTLLGRARAVFRLLLASPADSPKAEHGGDFVSGEESGLAELAHEASPRELFRALAAALTQAWGKDALAATHEFALAIYVPETTQAEEKQDG